MSRRLVWLAMFCFAMSASVLVEALSLALIEGYERRLEA